MFKNDGAERIAITDVQAPEQELTEVEEQSVQGGFSVWSPPGNEGCFPPIFGPRGSKIPWLPDSTGPTIPSSDDILDSFKRLQKF